MDWTIYSSITDLFSRRPDMEYKYVYIKCVKFKSSQNGCTYKKQNINPE